MALRIYIKQQTVLGVQVFPGQEIHYSGPNPMSLTTVAGPLPVGPRQWPQYGTFIDATEYVSDLHDLQLTWSIAREETGIVTPGAFQPKKGVSGTLNFEGEAFRLLKAWLFDDVSAHLNAVEVKIYDTSCKRWYIDYNIKSSDISWCESEICSFDIVLKQKDEPMICFKRTMIADNWQGWYQKKPANGKKHPRFSYCNEARPNGMLIFQWWFAGVIMVPLLFVFIPLALAINSIIFILQLIENVLNAIPGVNVSFNLPGYISFGDITDSFGQYYVESAGCGREHPASLIRDYITNVCDKCGITVNASTAPILFATTLTIETSDRGIISEANPYYNACLFHAPVKRGLRRFRSLGIPFNAADANDEYWIPDNDPLWTGDMLLDKIKGIFNAEWRIINGVLYFQRKDFYLNDNYIFDFSAQGPDRSKILRGICYEPNEKKYPAYITGLYSLDGSDTKGNEAGGKNGAGQMSGIVSIGNVDDNPNFEGKLEKVVEFGATKFRLDGASTDYIYDAMQVVTNGAVFTPFAPLQMSLIAQQIREYADYALLLQEETAVLPKILCWDGERYENARAIKLKAAWPGVAPQPLPDNNPAYNTGHSWQQRHEPQTFVIGSSVPFVAQPNGIYRVTDYFGIVITENPAILVNYPMYFEPFYYDTLWDRFHWIDDPRLNPQINMNWEVEIEMCCEDMERIKADNGAQDIVLGNKVLLDLVYYSDGIIKEIAYNFQTDSTYGQSITLSGTV